jgi:hypothetical protein
MASFLETMLDASTLGDRFHLSMVMYRKAMYRYFTFRFHLSWPYIDMPRLGSTSRGHIPICHVFHCHVTHITIRDGIITPRIPLPCHPHYNTWWHHRATYSIAMSPTSTIRDGTITPHIPLLSLITPSTQDLLSQIHALSRDLPDHTRWFSNRRITVIPLTGPRFPPVAPSKSSRYTSLSSRCTS